MHENIKSFAIKRPQVGRFIFQKGGQFFYKQVRHFHTNQMLTEEVMNVQIRTVRWYEIFALHKLINKEASINGTVLRKSHWKLLRMIGNYHVAIFENRIIGCTGYKIWPGRFCEIVSVVTSKAFRGKGIGMLLVNAVIKDIEIKGYRNIFCLTGAVDFFAKLGFRVDEKKRYPQKIWSDCKGCKKNIGDPLDPVCPETAMTYEFVI